MMELVSYDDGSLQCTARHTGLGSLQKKVFSKASLLLDGVDGRKFDVLAR